MISVKVVDDKRKNYFIHSIFSKPVKGKLSFHIAMSLPKDIFSRMHSGDSLPQVYSKNEGAATLEGEKYRKEFSIAVLTPNLCSYDSSHFYHTSRLQSVSVKAIK
jgi:hypothetical protein